MKVLALAETGGGEGRRENPLPAVPVTLTWRCRRCEKLLCEYVPPVVYVRCVCPRCGAWNVLAT